MTNFQEQYEQLSAQIRQAAADPAVRSKMIEQFMDGLFTFYLDLNQTPEERKSAAFQQFIEQTSVPVAEVASNIEYSYMDEVNDLLGKTWYGHEWLKVVHRRSALAALLDLYADSELDPIFDTEDLDRMLRERSQYEGYLDKNEIPTGVPQSHVWWWLPNKPE